MVIFNSYVKLPEGILSGLPTSPQVPMISGSPWTGGPPWSNTSPGGWFISMGKSQSKMDENWRYPHFRKPPCTYIDTYIYIHIYIHCIPMKIVRWNRFWLIPVSRFCWQSTCLHRGFTFCFLLQPPISWCFFPWKPLFFMGIAGGYPIFSLVEPPEGIKLASD